MTERNWAFRSLPRRSRSVRVVSDRGTELDVPFAATYLRRLRGLLLGGDTLLLHPCNSVHGFGMRRALDVAYIDQYGTVLDVAQLRPWRAHRPRRGAVAAWEAPLGRLGQLGVERGSTLRFAAV